MDPNVWVTAITVMILTVISFIFSSSGYSRLSWKQDDTELYEFKPSKWALGLALVGASMSLAFFEVPYSYPSPDLSSYIWVWIVVGGMGFVWLTICLIYFFKVKSSYCRITKDYVELKYGRRIKVVEFSNICSADPVHFDIFLCNSDRKLELKIPMIFKDRHYMLEVLRQRMSGLKDSNIEE